MDSTTTTHIPTRVYLSFRYITKRRVGISDLSQEWVVAEWIARGTGVVVYKSKQCGAPTHDAARNAAAKLARAWLARQNERPSMSRGHVAAAMEWTGPRYEDTTTTSKEH